MLIGVVALLLVHSDLVALAFGALACVPLFEKWRRRRAAR
jgi:hypothetical protein